MVKDSNSITEKSQQYKLDFCTYQRTVQEIGVTSRYPHSVEFAFEALNDWSIFHTLDDVKDWFEKKRETAPMRVIDIPINETKGWFVEKDTGNIRHSSNDFFYIHGVRVLTDSREVGVGGWDQPIVEQIGYDGGILGLLRKRFRGIPHYLCEAKMEPGNYGKVQLSPTLQATFANLRKSHGGKKPHYAEFFEEAERNSNIRVLFDSWLAEDGGRLYLKRNRGMLIEISEEEPVELMNNNFIWLSLYQIKTLLDEDAWINPHIRGIIAHG